MGSERATALADALRAASRSLVAVVQTVDEAHWGRVPGPGIWSIGKDVEHVAEACDYHQWIVRRTIGEPVAARKPVLERKRLVTALSRSDALAELERTTDAGIRLVARLTDTELDRRTNPPRGGGRERLGETIERVLIGHYHVHRGAIEAKLR